MCVPKSIEAAFMVRKLKCYQTQEIIGMKNKTAYLHMSHLLLVLCFAQSITGSTGEYAETLRMKPGLGPNSDLEWK